VFRSVGKTTEEKPLGGFSEKTSSVCSAALRAQAAGKAAGW
jgi:hypothetical protein